MSEENSDEGVDKLFQQEPTLRGIRTRLSKLSSAELQEFARRVSEYTFLQESKVENLDNIDTDISPGQDPEGLIGEVIRYCDEACSKLIIEDDEDAKARIVEQINKVIFEIANDSGFDITEYPDAVSMVASFQTIFPDITVTHEQPTMIES